jgi:hypothetical protein
LWQHKYVAGKALVTIKNLPLKETMMDLNTRTQFWQLGRLILLMLGLALTGALVLPNNVSQPNEYVFEHSAEAVQADSFIRPSDSGMVPSIDQSTLQDNTPDTVLNWPHYHAPKRNPYKTGDIVYATLDFERVCDCTDIKANTRGEVTELVDEFDYLIRVKLPDGSIETSNHAWWAPSENQ